MRVVLDTNVLMSGLFWRGKPAQVLEAWRDRRFDLVISPEVYAEYERVGKQRIERRKKWGHLFGKRGQPRLCCRLLQGGEAGCQPYGLTFPNG